MIVILPGMDGSAALRGELIDALGGPDEASVIEYPSDRALDYADLENRVRDALPAGKPFILVGESFSGPLAVALAADAAPGLRGLVLVCSFVKSPAPVPRMLSCVLGLLPFWRLPGRLVAKVLLGKQQSAAPSRRLAAAIASVRPAVWRRRLRQVLQTDVTGRLREVRVPVLYLRAKSDRVVPASAAH